MPIYEYVCKTCDTKFDELVRDADGAVPKVRHFGGESFAFRVCDEQCHDRQARGFFCEQRRRPLLRRRVRVPESLKQESRRYGSAAYGKNPCGH